MDSSAPLNPFVAPQSELIQQPEPGAANGDPLPWSPVDALKFGWGVLRNEPTIALWFLLALAVPSVLSIIGTLVTFVGSKFGSREMAVAGAVVYLTNSLLVGPALLLWIGAGAARVSLLKARGQPAVFADIFRAPFWSSLGLGLPFALGALASACIYFTPCAILVLALHISQCVMTDRRAGPLRSLTTSWSLTAGHRLALLVFSILALGVAVGAALIGVVTCGVGLIASVPTAAALLSIATAFIYLSLSGERPTASSRAATRAPNPRS